MTINDLISSEQKLFREKLPSKMEMWWKGNELYPPKEANGRICDHDEGYLCEDRIKWLEAWLAEHDRRIVQEAFKAVEVEKKKREGMTDKVQGYNAANSLRRQKESEFLNPLPPSQKT